MEDNELWTISVDPTEPEEAIKALRQRVAMLPAEFYALDAKAKQRAFTVSEATRLDQVNDVLSALERAIRDGLTLAQFKREIKDRLGQAWGGKGYALEAVFRTNVQQAYSVARYHGARRPENIRARPYGRFNALEDGRICDTCGDCNGVTLPLDDAWWETHQPVLHVSCRCQVDTLRPDEVDELTKFEDLPNVDIDDGFGGVDELDDWSPKLDNKDREAADIFQQRTAEEE